jgi:rhodanese-related sulfurtransferase/rubrerythrin
MPWKNVRSLTSVDLGDYRNGHREKEYLLVDVRQPEEYTAGHIPGARLLPLMELESKLFELPSDRDLVFYCRSGARSMAAASLAAEADVTAGAIYNLRGGIMAFEGKVLPDLPRVEVFDRSAGTTALLLRAMDLEKGAWRFYHHIKNAYADKPYAGTFERLSQAEEGHARLVYRFWSRTQVEAAPFTTLFDGLPGDIMEGGESLSALLSRLETLTGNLCLNLMETALNIEYAAFDLYRTMAEEADDETSREAFLSISQSEKAHIRSIAQALSTCPNLGRS